MTSSIDTDDDGEASMIADNYEVGEWIYDHKLDEIPLGSIVWVDRMWGGGRLQLATVIKRGIRLSLRVLCQGAEIPVWVPSCYLRHADRKEMREEA